MNKCSTRRTQQQRTPVVYRSSSVDILHRFGSSIPINSRNNVLERAVQNPVRFQAENGMMILDGYTARHIRPAARAINRDFGLKAKAMLQSETRDAIEQDILVFVECSCINFTSNLLCATCNTHWEQDQTLNKG